MAYKLVKQDIPDVHIHSCQRIIKCRMVCIYYLRRSFICDSNSLFDKPDFDTYLTPEAENLTDLNCRP